MTCPRLRDRRRAISFYFLIALGIFIAVIIMLLKVFTSVTVVKDRPVGTAQTSILRSGLEGDKALVYLDASARFAAIHAKTVFNAESGTTKDFEGGGFPCGSFMGAALWNDGAKRCIPSFEEKLLQAFEANLSSKLAAHPEYGQSYPTFMITATPKGSKTLISATGEAPFSLDFKGGGTSGFKMTAGSPFAPDYLPASVPYGSLNSGSRGSKSVEYIVVHYTVSPTAEGAVKTLQSTRKSYHYIIDHDGSVIQLVPEDRSAQHAGCPNDHCSGSCCLRPGMNSPSIGISFVNCGFDTACQGKGKDALCDLLSAGVDGHACWEPYTDEQLESFESLVADITRRNPQLLDYKGNFDRTRMFSHSDIDSGKSDPGPAFTMRTDTVIQGIDALIADPPDRIPLASDAADEASGDETTGNAILLTGRATETVSAKTLKNLEAYDDIITAYSKKNDLDPAIVKALITHESRGNAQAASPANALGLMQIVPFTTSGKKMNHDFCVKTGCGFTPSDTLTDAVKQEYFDPEKNVCCGTAFFATLTKKKPIEWHCCGKKFDAGVCIDATYDQPYEIGARRFNGAGCGGWVDPDYVESIMGLYEYYNGNPGQFAQTTKGSFQAAYQTIVSTRVTVDVDLRAVIALKDFAEQTIGNCTDDVEACLQARIDSYNAGKGANATKLSTDCAKNKPAEDFAAKYAGCAHLQLDKDQACAITFDNAYDRSAVDEKSIIYVDTGGISLVGDKVEDRLSILNAQAAGRYLKDGVVTEGPFGFLFNRGFLTGSSSINALYYEGGEPKKFTLAERTGKNGIPEEALPFARDDQGLYFDPQASSMKDSYPTRFLLCERTAAGERGLTFAIELVDKTPPAVTDVTGGYNLDTAVFDITWTPVTAYPDGSLVPDIMTYEVYCSPTPFEEGAMPSSTSKVASVERIDKAPFPAEEYRSVLKMRASFAGCGAAQEAQGMLYVMVLAQDRYGQHTLPAESYEMPIVTVSTLGQTLPENQGQGLGVLATTPDNPEESEELHVPSLTGAASILETLTPGFPLSP